MHCKLQPFYLSLLLVIVELSYSEAFHPTNVSETVPSTTARPAALTAADNVALLIVNSIRATYQAPPVTYSLILRTAAAKCAETYATTNPTQTLPLQRPSCAGIRAGVTLGVNGQVTSNGVRAIITDTCAPDSWFAQYINNAQDFPPVTTPKFSAAYQDFTQMIWASTTRVGCAFSTTQVQVTDDSGMTNPMFIYLCLWTPAGNSAAHFIENVRADI